MKEFLATLFLFVLSSITFANEKPNIVYIICDDLGYGDVHCLAPETSKIPTPNADRLASEGMVFTDAYSAAANCAPARACLLSGQYTPRHEIYNVGTGARGKAAYRKLLHVPGTATLDPDIKTWAHQLQAAGYTTATMGKINKRKLRDAWLGGDIEELVTS